METSVAKIISIFESQRAFQYQVAKSSFKERKVKLLALKKAVKEDFRQEIRDALWADFKKPQAETDLTEVFAITSEIDHTLAYLESWMSDTYVKTPLAYIGSASYVKYEPKGVCLIVAPWNFPVNLSLGPLVSAIAAGNTAIIKPSEYTPNSTKVIKKIVEAVFQENEVAVIEGAVETSTELLKLPFNHIFFTGSPQVGKIVMRAAAENLSSVTLELGGKSPTIIDETTNLKSTAKRLAWAKFMNAGQICIAPDYVLIHESRKEAFIEEMKVILEVFYEKNSLENDSFASIVNQKNVLRIQNYLEDAIKKGAKIEIGGNINLKENRIEPTILSGLAGDSLILKEEIFGPVLPILTYNNKEEVIEYIRKGEKPLALYIYSKKKENIDYFLNNTRAGGSCVNNSDMHFLQPYLPFGGENNSGIGKAHGEWGYKAFSNERSVYVQNVPSVLELLMPPYNSTKNKVIEWVVKWF